MRTLSRTYFREWDSKAIYDLVLSKDQYEDIRYWSFEQNSHYSVKTAHKTLQVFMEDGIQTGISTYGVNFGNYKSQGRLKYFSENP